jgi:NADH-quinone oxidoreductase subunit L
MPVGLLWYILLTPIFSFGISAFIIRPFFNQNEKQRRFAGYITIAAIATSLILSCWALVSVNNNSNHELTTTINWATIGNFQIKLGLWVDPLAAVMLIVVTVVSLMVQIYSQAYMQGDTGYTRYYASMSLFTASMLGLVMADNLLFMYVFWEGVGLCSYLLIGFWFHKPSAANAAKKAFIVTRLGDFGFLAAVLFLYFKTGTFNIQELHGLAGTAALSGMALTWAAVGIFAGAMGKSAQFPLHVWLPDAMEGPTPVSALIHAATMVAAGVFLVARTFPLFAASHEALMMVATIGAFTAIFAASMGLVANDIKRVLAYSTISQLGYMMLALGAGGLFLARHNGGSEEAYKVAIIIGIFHLFNHAFFKALLFLGAGSVSHSTNTFDMQQMGGLRKYMPWTFVLFVIASLSLAGIWPLAGFWSKDEIIDQSWHALSGGELVLFFLAMITVFMTAFYMFRAVFLTFGGEYRGTAAQNADSHGSAGHGTDSHSATSHTGQHSQSGHGLALHESPWMMLGPMLLLGVLAICSGWFNATGRFNEYLGEGHGYGWVHGLFGVFKHPLPWISLVAAFSGIFLAYAIYSARWLSAEKIGQTLRPFYVVLSRKYWMDELYERGLVVKVLLNGLFRLIELFDTYIVDGIVNGVARITGAFSRLVRRAQTGDLQSYGIAMGLGILVITIVLYLTR